MQEFDSLIWIADAGHGGMINGVYQTAGKRSPNWEKGIYYEGAGNRWFINRVLEKCDRYRIPYFHVSPEHRDVSLEERCRRANEIHSYYPNVYLGSWHSNAGGGTGLEIYTSTGHTLSDPIADFIGHSISQQFQGLRFRADYADGDIDKERDFYILRNTTCPAFLFENLFMDTIGDYRLLWDEKYMDEMVETVVCAVNELHQHGTKLFELKG